MALEDKHLDILQNIESGIVGVYKKDSSLQDQDVIKALDSIIAYYRAIATRKEFKMPDNISDKEKSIFDAVTTFLGLREELVGDNPTPKRKSFSRALRVTTKEEIYLACLRKIKKSATRWNKRNGKNGYLNFVKNYA